MISTQFVVILLTYIVGREIFYLYTVNKLMNKLMSRNYHEFKMAENVGKTTQPKIQATLNEEMHEDLGALVNIGL